MNKHVSRLKKADDKNKQPFVVVIFIEFLSCESMARHFNLHLRFSGIGLRSWSVALSRFYIRFFLVPISMDLALGESFKLYYV